MIQNTSGSQPPLLALEPVAKSKKILTIKSWMSFLIFVVVYTRQLNSEAPALIKYGEIIKDLAAKGHGWRFNDENFRYLRQHQVSSFPGNNIHWELWLRSQQSQVRKSTLSQNPSKVRFADSPAVPKGYYFKLNITKEVIAWVVPLSTLATNAKALTHPTGVLFFPQQSQNLSVPYRPSLSLPTPVKFERLHFLLSGCDH